MLSILIPTYNYNVYPLVHSLQKQCNDAGIIYEIIVLDDASPNTDVTEIESINKLPYCAYTVLPKNIGRTQIRKSLAEKAKYDTLLFLDADVIPVADNFIKEYLPYVNTENLIVVGGYAYKDGPAENNSTLRLKYGREREQKTAAQRSNNPYESIFSGNFLIDKKTFLENNYSGNNNFYGMDIYFGYSLRKNNITVIHIDNPIYHLGLENDQIFFTKSLQSVKNRKEVMENLEGIENINSLLLYYKKLKKYHLTGLVAFLFSLTGPLLKKMVLKKDPSLFCFDIYRLGYLCSLK